MADEYIYPPPLAPLNNGTNVMYFGNGIKVSELENTPDNILSIIYLCACDLSKESDDPELFEEILKTNKPEAIKILMNVARLAGFCKPKKIEYIRPYRLTDEEASSPNGNTYIRKYFNKNIPIEDLDQLPKDILNIIYKSTCTIADESETTKQPSAPSSDKFGELLQSDKQEAIKALIDMSKTVGYYNCMDPGDQPPPTKRIKKTTSDRYVFFKNTWVKIDDVKSSRTMIDIYRWFMDQRKVQNTKSFLREKIINPSNANKFVIQLAKIGELYFTDSHGTDNIYVGKYWFQINNNSSISTEEFEVLQRDVYEILCRKFARYLLTNSEEAIETLVAEAKENNNIFLDD
jgi:hypothetical protein